MHMPEERSDSNSCAFLRKSADIGGDVGFCLLAACLLLACCLLVAIFELFCAVPGCENMHIPKERSDFAYCVLRQKSTHSSENSAAKKCTFRRKGVILHLACSGEKVQFPDAKKCTCRRKGVIWLLRVAAEMYTFIGKFGGENAHIPKERCDFASCL